MASCFYLDGRRRRNLAYAIAAVPSARAADRDYRDFADERRRPASTGKTHRRHRSAMRINDEWRMALR